MGIIRKIFGADTTTDVLGLLESQHKEVDDLLAQIESGNGNRRALLVELADKLGAHATAEEKVFYPAIMAKQTNEMLQEAVEEHLAIKRILADLVTMKLEDDAFKAKLSVLKEQVAHHAHEEEEKKLFPKVKDLFSRDERAALGNEVLVAFEEALAASPHKLVPAETAAAAPLPNAPRR
jgi:hemerythrin superfamily protein